MSPTNIRVHHGGTPAAIQLSVGTVLRATSDASPRQPWGPLISSDESVVRCTSQPLPDGSIAATCVPLAPGTATIHTTTAPFARGLKQHHWRLVVSVV